MRRLLPLFVAAALVAPSACRRHRHGPKIVRATGIAARAERLVLSLSRGKLADARRDFDPTMRALLTEGALGETWKGLVARAGAFQAIAATREEAPKDGFRIVAVTTRHAGTKVDVRVVFDAKQLVAGLWFDPLPQPWSPPSYADAKAFEEREVLVSDLPGTLTLPKSPRPARAVVLVHGSGPHDRDESLGGVKVFKDLAWGLASRGVASLRYVKRTRHAPGTLTGAFDLDDEVSRDARAAVALLAEQSEIDAKHVVLVGHSLGGRMAPRIARGEERIAGLVVLAGDTRPFEQLLIEQTRYLLALEGVDDATRASKLEAIRNDVRRVRSEGPLDELLSVAGSKAPRKYWLDLLRYRGDEAAKETQLPMLFVQGARDYQVTLADFEGWKRALAGRPGVSFAPFPTLNHLLVAGDGPSVPDEYRWPGHVSQEVVEAIARFVDGLT